MHLEKHHWKKQASWQLLDSCCYWHVKYSALKTFIANQIMEVTTYTADLHANLLHFILMRLLKIVFQCINCLRSLPDIRNLKCHINLEQMWRDCSVCLDSKYIEALHNSEHLIFSEQQVRIVSLKDGLDWIRMASKLEIFLTDIRRVYTTNMLTPFTFAEAESRPYKIDLITKFNQRLACEVHVLI